MTNPQLADMLLQVIHDYEANHQQKLQEAENSIKRLEAEAKQLRDEADQGSSILDDIADEHLKKRLASLVSSPLDTLVREAGVVLEDRLRRLAGSAGTSLTGTALADVVLAPEKGVVAFSSNVGEQQGVHMLYRGAMQFIRNPPMHNLIEYQASTAQILIRLIDSLLRLLAEAPAVKREDVKLDDIRRMLKRIPIPPAQRQLYEALYKAGDKGLSGGEISIELKRSRSQLAGVIGALGLRINATEGLGNKGGVAIIFDISRISSGDYVCKMKPLLRKALELENIV